MSKNEPNRIIKFLEGKWYCKNTIIIPKQDKIESEYEEEMIIKDHETISITAFGVNNGKDLSKDLSIKVNDVNEVTLSQGDYVAKGKILGNTVFLTNNSYQGNRYDTRLYLLDNWYLYEMDVWKDGDIIQTQISYLNRL